MDGLPLSQVSAEPAISSNGRYVAFTTFATNVFNGDTNGTQDVFVRDLQAGTNALVSAAKDGGFGDGASRLPKISDDGRYVLYRSDAKNLVTGTFTFLFENLFLRDRLLQTNYCLTTNGVVDAAMTPDGRYSAYIGSLTGFTPTLYIWDATIPRRIYTNTSSSLSRIAISPNGRRVAYVSFSSLFAYDLISKTTTTITSGATDMRANPQFSTDARFMVYVTKAAMITSDTNSLYDVYLHDFQAASDTLVSKNSFSGSGNNVSLSPTISPDGRFVAYCSYASDIVPKDTNGTSDVYLFDRLNNSTALISVNRARNGTGAGLADQPVFSADSQNLIFKSYASDLSPSEYGAIYAQPLTSSSLLYTNGGAPGATNVPALLNLQMAGDGAASYPVINWSAAPGTYYQVQYKTNLTDPDWLPFTGNSTVVGDKGQAADSTPGAQRFYRVMGN